MSLRLYVAIQAPCLNLLFSAVFRIFWTKVPGNVWLKYIQASFAHFAWCYFGKWILETLCTLLGLSHRSAWLVSSFNLDFGMTRCSWILQTWQGVSYNQRTFLAWMWSCLIGDSDAFPGFSQIVERPLNVIALWWSVKLLHFVVVWDTDFYKVKRTTKFPLLKTLILLTLLTKHDFCINLIWSIRWHCMVICWYLYCIGIINLQLWNVTRNLCHISREYSSR